MFAKCLFVLFYILKNKMSILFAKKCSVILKNNKEAGRAASNSILD